MTLSLALVIVAIVAMVLLSSMDPYKKNLFRSKEDDK